MFAAYSESNKRLVAIQLGNITYSELERHVDAAENDIAPQLLAYFRVTVGSFDSLAPERGFLPFDGISAEAFALVMPLATPLVRYVETYGIVPSLVEAWANLVQANENAKRFHCNVTPNNVVLIFSKGKMGNTKNKPTVAKMLLINWRLKIDTSGVRERTVAALDAAYAYENYFETRDARAALESGLLLYMARSAMADRDDNVATTTQTKRYVYAVVRDITVAALNAAARYNGSARNAAKVIPNTLLVAFIDQYNEAFYKSVFNGTPTNAQFGDKLYALGPLVVLRNGTRTVYK